MQTIQSGLLIIVFLLFGGCNNGGAAEEEPPDTTETDIHQESVSNGTSPDGSEHDASVEEEPTAEKTVVALPQEAPAPAETVVVKATPEEMHVIPSGVAFMVSKDAGLVEKDAGVVGTDAAIVDAGSVTLTVETLLKKFPTYHVSPVAQKECGIKPISDCAVNADMLDACDAYGKDTNAPSSMLMQCLVTECYHQQVQASCFMSLKAPQGNSFGGMNECEATRNALADLYVVAQSSNSRFKIGAFITFEVILSTYYDLTIGMFEAYQSTPADRDTELQSLMSNH